MKRKSFMIFAFAGAVGMPLAALGADKDPATGGSPVPHGGSVRGEAGTAPSGGATTAPPADVRGTAGGEKDPATGGSPKDTVGRPGQPSGGAAAGSTSAPGAAAGASAAGGQREFERLDTNRDGFISREEAKASSHAGGHFNSLDTDRDGKLSAMEFGGVPASPGGGGGSGSQ